MLSIESNSALAHPELVAEVGTSTWIAGNALNIQTIEAALNHLSTLLVDARNAKRLRIDLSHVALIDTAAIQLLLALASEAKRRDVTLEYTGISRVVEHAFKTLGFCAIAALGGSQ